jgi:hypothetical protein
MQASFEAHDTPRKASPPVTGLRLGTTDQRAPFQDSARVLATPLLFPEPPTAMHATGETHDTPDRSVPLLPGVGLGTTDQRLPRS